MKKKQIFLIVGRSGVGKSSIVKAVCDITGMSCVKSYTTRPRREDEKEHTDHIFISENVSLAQPVEHLPFKEGAVGSNPTRDTIIKVA